MISGLRTRRRFAGLSAFRSIWSVCRAPGPYRSANSGNRLNVLSSPRTTPPNPKNQLHVPKPLREHLAMAFGVGVPFAGLLAAVLLLWGRGLGWTELALLLGFYTFSILGVTIGFHRMFTHRALAAGPAVRFVLGVAGSMSAQGPVLEWCAMHRQHHKHSDHDGDPHSPHLHGRGLLGLLRGMWHAHLGWLFAAEPAAAARNVPDLLADRVLVFVDRWFWAWMLAGWVIPGVIGGLVLGSWQGALSGFLWGGLVRTFLLHHVTWSINSVCHMWGTRPFGGHDESRNNALLGVLAFGEGWHNNHHAFPTSARHGLRWWELDLTYWVIRLLEWMGLVWNVRVVPASGIEQRLAPALGRQPDSV
jgi:stearoyl-CoA desaturase (delta-9 desaturase)